MSASAGSKGPRPFEQNSSARTGYVGRRFFNPGYDIFEMSQKLNIFEK